MRKIGVKWEPRRRPKSATSFIWNRASIFIRSAAASACLLALREIALKWQSTCVMNRACVPYTAIDRRVEGVRVSTPEGEYDLASRSIICCSGGFQASAAMRARYLGANTDFVKVRGSKHNTGEVLQMMLDLGAASAGHWQGAHMTPIDASAPAVETPSMHKAAAMR